MPKFLEDKLKQEYGDHSSIPYKIMNAQGYMHGNKETSKGKLAEKKHKMASKMRDIKPPKRSDGPNPITPISTVSHLRRIADLMTARKHVEIKH